MKKLIILIALTGLLSSCSLPGGVEKEQPYIGKIQTEDGTQLEQPDYEY